MSIPDDRSINFKLLYCNKWIFPIAGYLVYVILFLVGYFLDIDEFNIIGVSLFLCITCIGLYKNILEVKKDITILYATLVIVFQLIAMLYNQNAAGYSYILKHVVTYGCYILIFSAGFIPLRKQPENKYIFIALLIVLGISLLSGRYFIREDEVRLSGVFSDPNSLSLMGLSLFFFIDENDANVIKKIWIHAVVLVVLAFTATSGAYLALFSGLVYKFRKQLLKKWTLLLVVLLVSCLLMCMSNFDSILSMSRILNQIDVAYQNMHLVKEMGEIDFGSLIEEYSLASLTGLWRMYQWLKTLLIYASGSVLVILFGYGVGSSMELLGNVPHNEYLRALFEQGAVGLLLLSLFYSTIIRRLDRKYDYIIVMLSVFAITQNIVENMMFMILFMLYIATSQTKKNITTDSQC